MVAIRQSLVGPMIKLEVMYCITSYLNTLLKRLANVVVNCNLQSEQRALTDCSAPHLVELEGLSGDLDGVRRREHSASQEDVFHEVSGVAGHRVVLSRGGEGGRGSREKLRRARFVSGTTLPTCTMNEVR